MLLPRRFLFLYALFFLILGGLVSLLLTVGRIPSVRPAAVDNTSRVAKAVFSYAKADGQVYIRRQLNDFSYLKNNSDQALETVAVYSADDGDGRPRPVNLGDEDQYSWNYLAEFVTAASPLVSVDVSLSGFNPVPGTDNFFYSIKMTETYPPGNSIAQKGGNQWVRLFYYNDANKTITEITNPGPDNSLGDPRIVSISPDKNYAVIRLYPKPDQLQVNLTTLKSVKLEK
jgi:hypothetical protein